MSPSLYQKYILDGHQPVAVADDDPRRAEFLDPELRRVAWTEINAEIHVSTAFMPLDLRLSEDEHPLPLLFETMVFGGPLDQMIWRYATWDEAVTGHEAVVRKVREALEEK